MEQYKQEFIEFMIDCQVLKFGEFVTKSVFCKHRILPHRRSAEKAGRVLCKGDCRHLWNRF